AALEGLQAQGIRVLLAHSGAEPTASWQEIQLELVGNDRPGIVCGYTHLLAEHGGSVESLDTEVL
ncbi:MAG TPA: glycine cleavage system protein R, partial [Pseudomonas sp.]|nr:glycine cleavage system protein R [Pseudomonas sp.]